MIKFNVDTIDNPWNLTVRAGTIKEAGFSMPTPLRVLNTKEIVEAKKIADSNLAIPNFPHPIFELTKYFKPAAIQGLTSNAQASSGLINSINKISLMAGARFTIFHPVLNRTLTVTDEINKKLIALQCACDVDAISIIDEYNSKPLIFRKRLVKSMEQIDNMERPFEPTPTIRMDTDDRKFKDKLKIVFDNDINVLNLIYSNIKEHWANYSYLIKSLRKQDKIWVHMSELNKIQFKKSSLVHTMPLFGIDSYALNYKPLGFGTFNRVPALVKRFDSGTLGYLEPSECGENTNCSCFVDNNLPLKQVLDLYSGSDLLSSAMTCHDTVSSLHEFIKSRSNILNQDYRDYIRSKSHMEIPMKKLFNVEIAQTQLL